jgi:pimeloyl-ACP methyl ester carboxylesterase
MLSLLPATALAKSALAAGDQPTIVLVHGAWAGPSGWDQVAAGLRKDGYAVETPTLGLVSIGGDAAIVASTLDAINGDKILVGHSYGGIVISNAAYARSDVLGLVFTAAFVPDEDDSILSLGAGFPPSDLVNHLVFDPFPFAYIDRPFFPAIFAQDLSPKKAAVLNAGQRPINAAILGSPSGPIAWDSLPSWYAVSGADLVIDPAQQRSMASRAGSAVVEFDDASHAGGYTHYATRFVKLIEQAVEATAS